MVQKTLNVLILKGSSKGFVRHCVSILAVRQMSTLPEHIFADIFHRIPTVGLQHLPLLHLLTNRS